LANYSEGSSDIGKNVDLSSDLSNIMKSKVFAPYSQNEYSADSEKMSQTVENFSANTLKSDDVSDQQINSSSSDFPLRTADLTAENTSSNFGSDYGGNNLSGGTKVGGDIGDLSIGVQNSDREMGQSLKIGNDKPQGIYSDRAEAHLFKEDQITHNKKID